MSVEFDFFLAIRAAHELDRRDSALSQIREASQPREQPPSNNGRRLSPEPQAQLTDGTRFAGIVQEDRRR